MIEYVDHIQLPKSGTFRYWTYNNTVTTLINNGITYKSLKSWDGDLSWALESLELWKKLGYKGNPSSPASFFHEVFNTPRVNYSITSSIQPYFHGAIQQTFLRGTVEPPLYYYDLKSAYLWAGLRGLPTRYKPYEPGDRDFIAIWENTAQPLNAPLVFNRKRIIIDSADIECYGLTGNILWAVSYFDKSHFVGDTFEELIKYMPERTLKKITQTYWGRWASTTPVFMVNVNGKVRKNTMLKSIFSNYIWATIIVHRVIRRVWEYKSSETVLIIADALLNKVKIPTGNMSGCFRLKETYDRSLIIKAPGVWTMAPANSDLSLWVKHSGYERRA
jgi:hypothetical protein